MEEHICEYGCSQIAKYKFKNGKWCCSKSTSQCIGLKDRFISVNNVKMKCPSCEKDIVTSCFKQHIASCKINSCLNCGSKINKGKKFCDSSCSAIYNNAHSDNLKNCRRGPLPICGINVWKPKECRRSYKYFCENCGKLTYNKKYCSNKCFREKQAYLKKVEIESNIGRGEPIHPPTLKKYLIQQRGHKCEICNSVTWNNKPIPLVLDHIDGNHTHNTQDNLRLVCGNCDMQLPTYKGKNVGKGRYYRRKRYQEGKSY